MVAEAPAGLGNQQLVMARLHPTWFGSVVRRNYKTYPLHWRIGDALRAVADGEIDRLMVNVHPRVGKSTLASLIYPAWYLGRYPDRRYIGASYSADLIRGAGRGARNIVGFPEYQRVFPGVHVDRSSAAADRWDIEGHEGGYLGTSVGGAITGHGAHVLGIDDPTKGRLEAMSDVVRQNVIDWYEHDAYSRLEPDGAIIIIQTRWHEDDLSGHLLQAAADDPEADQWTQVSLPAITCAKCGAFPHMTNCSGTYEAIEPERFDVPSLLRIRQNIGARAFEAEYQQSPTLPEGNIFKREWMERRYTARWFAEQRPRDIKSGKMPRWWTIQTIDTATREGVGANYSCISTWGTDGISKFLLHVWRERVDYPDLKRAVQEQYFRWDPADRPRLVAVEDTTHGRPLYQEMTKDQGGIPLILMPTDGTKITRAESVTGWFETGTVVLPVDAEWLPAWLAEHLSFPSAAYDDQVDTTSMALRLLTQVYEVTKGGRVKWSR